MSEREKTPKYKKLTKDEFFYEINQLFQQWSREETDARNTLAYAGGIVDSINNTLQFVSASEEQGLRVTFEQDEETGDLRVDTLPKRPWQGLLGGLKRFDKSTPKEDDLDEGALPSPSTQSDDK